MKLHFKGSRAAELFSLETETSFQGVRDKLLISDVNDPDCGFVAASLPGYYWCDTMWSRDAGTILREFIHWGDIDNAKLLCAELLRVVGENEQGYYMYPEKFYKGEVRSGHELDGTGAILIAFSDLHRFLPVADPLKKQLEEFFLCERSPVFYILNELRENSLMSGSGEFGGGCGIDGMYVNVVQNNLIRLSLLASAKLYERIGRNELVSDCKNAAKRIENGILEHLVDADGRFIWCVDAESMQPNPDVLNAEVNLGCGLINGVLSMQADVLGFDLGVLDFAYEQSVNTFKDLYLRTPRKELFDKYGVWTQFDTMRPGCTGPSYGQGYAIQCMLLLNYMEMADKALKYLAEETYSPIPQFGIKRDSPYYFYERCYTPYSVEKGLKLEVGCGPLNLVNVAEPLKIARMLAGIDNSSDIPTVYAKLPESFSGYTAENAPVLCGNGVYFADIDCEKTQSGMKYKIAVKGESIPELRLKAGNSEKILKNITCAEAEIPF